MKATTILKGLVLGFSLVLGACASKPDHATPTMDDAAFVKSGPAERSKYLKDIQDEANALTTKKETEYAIGRPVYYGNKDTGYTLQWDKKLSLVYIYPGHNSGAMSMETQGVLSLRTDSKGNILYQKDNLGMERPTTLLANVATQEGLGRVLLKGGFQVLSSAVNGAWAADITTDCGKDCGDTWTIQGGNATAIGLGGQGGRGGNGIAAAGASSSSNASAGTCPSSGCTSTKKLSP